MSGAARLFRGHENFHHSMLIHTKHTIKNQSPVARKVESLVQYWDNHISNQYSSEGIALRERFRLRWEDEFSHHTQTNESWTESNHF